MLETKAKIFEFDGFRLEAAERRLTKNGESMTLPSKAFDLLHALVENGGHLVTKEELYRRVWADQFVEDANLTVQISAIRKALGAGYIDTVKGHGYRFAADVRELNGHDEIFLESKTFSRVTIEHESEAGSRPEPNAAGRRRPWRIALAGVAVAASIGVGGVLLRYAAFPNENSVAAGFRSGSIRRLTSTGKVGHAAAISPDGKLFAYSQFEGEVQSLWVGHVSGGEPIQIRPSAEVDYLSVRFSPDGATLYYAVSNGGLHRMPVFGGAPERVNESVRRTFALSPDGERLAFVRNKGEDEPAIVISSTSGGEEIVIGVPPTRLGFAGNSPAWSPDGSVIAAAAATNENGTSHDVFAVNIADGSVNRVTSSSFSGIDSLAWLRDGTGLIAVASGSLWHLSYPGGERTQLENDLSIYAYAMGLSASGNDLQAVQVQQYSNIWIAPADDVSQARQVTFGSLGRGDGWSGLDWTPDGKIVYTAVVNSMQTIWTMNADGTNQKQLTPNGRRNFHPSVSDDGRTIVFTSLHGGKYAIWRMNIDGAGLRQLTDADIAAQPHISPDGKWVVYISDREGFGTLNRIPIEGGEPVQLTEKKMCWVRVSPDGKYVAGGYHTGEQAVLAIVPMEGGEAVKTFDVPRQTNFRLGVRWAPDGKSIAYRDWSNGIWKQNVDGGPPERIAALPEEKLYSFGWSRDGKQFAYVRGQEIRDVVLLSKSPQR